MKIKKLLTILCISCITGTALAEDNNFKKGDTEIKLEGFYGFQAGYSTQNHLTGLGKYITDNKKRFALYSEAAFYLTAQQELNGMTVGAKLVLLPTTKPKTSVSYNGSHIFLETDYGKVEIGSPHDAQAKMRVTGYNVVAASGTNWSRYINLDSEHMSYQKVKPEFDTSDRFYMESFANRFDDMSEKTEPSRKISYYTPKMKGFQFGISYTPDSANAGGNRSLNYLDKTVTDRRFTLSKTGIDTVTLADGTIAIINLNVKDAFSAGISYEHELSDDLAIKIAATGEFAKAARSFLIIDDKTKRNVLQRSKISNLRAYNVGGVLTYGNFSCAASYGSLGKSLTTPEYHKNGRKTEFYNGAVAYKQGPIKTSLSYFKSLRYKNKVDTVALGTECILTPGLVPYAEIAYVKAKGRPVHYPEAPKKSTKGTVAIVGARLKF
ncbi:MAG: porin [Candidatus Rickettsia vulgarisii]